MRKQSSLIGPLLSAIVFFSTGCDLPGRPKPGPEVPRPEEVHSFQKLYAQNCAGCHGADGEKGSAASLANPEYEAWVDDASLRSVIQEGDKGALMPAFALSRGGTLTELQIDQLVEGMRAKWGSASVLGTATPPPYRPTLVGIANDGEKVYASACARCHGATAQQAGVAGSILDGSFLAVINARMLRTTLVAGRPDIGQPDWRNDIPGHALTDSEVTDLTAWLIAQTPAYSSQAQARGGYPGDAPPHVLGK